MSESDSDASVSSSRRRFFKGLSLIPLAVAVNACDDKSGSASAMEAASPPAPAYVPSFFSSAEWQFVHAACDRLIPTDHVGPGAVESGVPEFLDRHMQTPYASGAIWYTQGPFLEAGEEFGYQGRLNLRDMLRVGIAAMDTHSQKAFSGKTFAQLDHSQQETLLHQAEAGTLKLDNISAKLFFDYLLGEVRNGYFADPIYGGNKQMGAWKMIGYPGVRADYTDWVTVRDKPYPLPPVDLQGQRG